MRYTRKHKREAMRRIGDGSGIRVVTDLANDYATDDRVNVPAQETTTKHEPLPPVDNDQTVQNIATVLAAGLAFETTVSGVSAALRPFGITKEAVGHALSISGKGTAHRPNARLKPTPGAETADVVKDVRDNDLFYRAAYIANSAKRITDRLRSGDRLGDVISDERRYFHQHEDARKARLDAAAQVQTVARLFGLPDERGTLVGWYIDPSKQNESECLEANGNNFYAEEGTFIGLPGAVHGNCGCYAGPPHYGAPLVNEVLSGYDPDAKPKFKLRKG